VTSAPGTNEISRRYASALFALATEKNAVDSLANDVAVLSALLEQSTDFVKFCTNGVIPRATQERAVLAVAKASGLSALAADFLGLLARHRRLSELSGIIAALSSLIDDHRGETTAEVTTARPLDDAQKDHIAAALKKATGRNVRLTVLEDPSILGGLVIRTGSLLVDASVSARLARLSRALKSPGLSAALKNTKKEVA
jgi:F-type H+-transporting ATPase subunit delta